MSRRLRSPARRTAPWISYEAPLDQPRYTNPMNSPHTDEVSPAFEILLEAIEIEINTLNHLGGDAFNRRDYLAAKDLAQRAEQLAVFRTKVFALASDWHKLKAATNPSSAQAGDRPVRKSLGRLQKGTRTPETAYYRPLLEALVELGGAAEMRAVLDKLHPQMASVLKAIDHEPLPSGPKTGPRWRNTAQWARNTLRERGLLKNDSPHGLWEITEAGRRWLESTEARFAPANLRQRR